MGKTHKSKDSQKEAIHQTKKSPGETETSKSTAETLRAIKLPTSADGLTAEQLTAEQKIVFKKHCQNMYGHKYAAGKRKLPASSVESATVQLAAKMKERMQQMKSKNKNKEDASTSRN